MCCVDICLVGAISHDDNCSPLKLKTRKERRLQHTTNSPLPVMPPNSHMKWNGILHQTPSNSLHPTTTNTATANTDNRDGEYQHSRASSNRNNTTNTSHSTSHSTRKLSANNMEERTGPLSAYYTLYMIAYSR